MIYELAVVARPESTDDQTNLLRDLVKDVVTSFNGEILLEDDWGSLSFAQPDKNGGTRGRYTYIIFKTDAIENNTELARRFRISEDVLRHLIVKLGDNSEQESLLKNYKCPYSKTNNGSVTDEPENEDSDSDKERRRFSRKKNCWFSARKFKADWKDPKTFGWLINEFGKLTPARVSGISVKHQRFVTTAVKRARNIGIASYLSNYSAE